MDALTLLKTDHDKVKKLLADLEATTERGVRTREHLYTTIRSEMTVHEIIEEEIFYPALKDHPKAAESSSRGSRNTTWWTCSWASSTSCHTTPRTGVPRRRS